MAYYANGITVDSDIPLLGWDTAAICTDYRISLRRTDFLVRIEDNKWPNTYNDDCYLYFVWNSRIAIRLHHNLQIVQYMLGEEAEYWELTYALNYVLAYLAPYINKLAVHGCSIMSQSGKGIVLLGKTGMGKSTLLTQLLNLGYTFLGEEMIVIDCKTNTPLIFCSNKVLRLQKNSKLLNNQNNMYLHDVNEDKVAFWNPLYNTATGSVPLSAIIIMEREADSVYGIRKLSKMEAIRRILSDYLYMRSVIGHFDYRKLLQLALNMVSNIEALLYNMKDYPLVRDIVDSII